MIPDPRFPDQTGRRPGERRGNAWGLGFSDKNTVISTKSYTTAVGPLEGLAAGGAMVACGKIPLSLSMIIVVAIGARPAPRPGRRGPSPAAAGGRLWPW